MFYMDNQGKDHEIFRHNLLIYKIRSVENPLNLYVTMQSLRNIQRSLWQSLMSVSMRMNTNQAENSSLIKKLAPFILRKYSL